MKLTEKELQNIRKNHPAITYESCKNCGGYNTVLREFDKWEMTIRATCNQCGTTKLVNLVEDEPYCPACAKSIIDYVNS